ncbi:MAG TPA: ribose 5-phosphate isomerase B [Acidobacteriota bacterium]|nr:ribose 5-phosphate isomerase B [Acidobacteriota bacterium]
MKIAIASDHAGFYLKDQIKKTLDSLSITYEDLGPDDTDSVDYPDFARKVAEAVQNGSRGILCCGTGIGMSIAANKFKGIRAALCNDIYAAQMSREHNDANILIMGGRILKDSQEIESIVKTWLQTEFQGGRHQRRIDKISDFES